MQNTLPLAGYSLMCLAGILAVALPPVLVLRALQRRGSPLGVTEDSWLTVPRLFICCGILGSISVQAQYWLLGSTPWSAIGLALVMGVGFAMAISEISRNLAPAYVKSKPPVIHPEGRIFTDKPVPPFRGGKRRNEGDTK